MSGAARGRGPVRPLGRAVPRARRAGAGRRLGGADAVRRLGRARPGQPRRRRGPLGGAAARGADHRRGRRRPGRRPARGSAGGGGGDRRARQRSRPWPSRGRPSRTVHLSFGDFTAEEYAWQVLADHVVHSWDLAVAIGARPRAGAAGWSRSPPAGGRPGRTPTVDAGAVGPAVAVGDGASQQDRLVASSRPGPGVDGRVTVSPGVRRRPSHRRAGRDRPAARSRAGSFHVPSVARGLRPGRSPYGRRTHGHQRRQLLGCRVTATGSLSSAGLAHSGMFPCFFGGSVCRLVRRARSALDDRTSGCTTAG